MPSAQKNVPWSSPRKGWEEGARGSWDGFDREAALDLRWIRSVQADGSARMLIVYVCLIACIIY